MPADRPQTPPSGGMPGNAAGEPLRVGVLAVQGAVSEHTHALREAARRMGIEVEVTEVRTAAGLARVHGLVLPGGESTAMSRLLRSAGMRDPLVARGRRGDLALFGTCAGLILLSSEPGARPDDDPEAGLAPSQGAEGEAGQEAGPEAGRKEARGPVRSRRDAADVERLGLLDAEVDRNAFGRQRDSFESGLEVEGLGRMPAVFIRAPVVTRCWGGTKPLAHHDKGIVAVRNGRVLGTAFHPELTEDTRLHELFLGLVAEAAAVAPAVDEARVPGPAGAPHPA